METGWHGDRWWGRLGNVHMGSTVDGGILSRANVGEVRALRQVHGRLVLDDRNFVTEAPVGDGLITKRRETALVIRTADCVPVFLVGEAQIAMLHGGWRGVKDGIVQAGLRYFDEPSPVWAVLGAAICGEHYEVDRDLYADWLGEDWRLAAYLNDPGLGTSKRYLDLRGFIKRIMVDLGVMETRIHIVDACTFEGPLPSYRREGKAAKRIFNYIYRV